MRFLLFWKAIAIGMIIAILCVVLARIDALVGERKMRQIQAMQSVEQSLAGGQTLMGPLLQRTCTEEWTVVSGEGKTLTRTNERREFVLTSVPRSLVVSSDARADTRYRGLFKVNTYTGQTVLDAKWDDLSALQPSREHAGSRLTCNPARMMLAVSDVRGLRSVQALADGETRAVQPGTRHARYRRGVHAELPAERSERAGDPLSIRFALELVGTARLAVVPAAAQTNWALRSDWQHPSFGGRFLPAQREVGPNGFTASWTVSELASTAASEVQRAGELCEGAAAGTYRGPDDEDVASTNPKCLDTLSVAFIDPVNPYVLTDRAIKYALLFIVLTFTCVALVEILAGRRVHPVQYGLVGLALVMFYLLLLSLSEHLTFATAYAFASSACVALLGYYAAHMLRHRKGGIAFGAGVGALYAFLWVLLSLEQASLVVGSLLLFGALAAVMVLTRRLNWYALPWRAEPSDGSAAPPEGSA
jgi:inner membrane protein